MIINISDVWEKAAPRHYAFLNAQISNGLGTLSCSFLDMAIKDFIEMNRNIIVKGTPSQLTDCISDYESRFGKDLMHNYVSQRLQKIFDYDSFSKKSKKTWTAFHLCSLAKYKVCCYCHMVSTSTALPDENGKGYRPPLDHFYIKSDYPFLALTLSNLVPCCEKCNGSQMKHSVNFAVKPHLNPLLDAESIEFELRPLADDEIADALALQLSPTKYCLVVEAKLNHDLSNNSIQTFQLKSRYNDYSTKAFYLARKSRGFAARKLMRENALDFAYEIADLLEFEPDLYKDAEFGKARVCIAKQFGAIPN